MKVLAVLLSCSMGISAPLPSVQWLDRYGHPLRETGGVEGQRWQPVSLETISPWMILATLAAEDKRFFSHNGVDWQATARALWQNSSSGHIVSGGSTVTQQLVRLLEPHRKTWLGKAREAVEALWLEHRQSKRDILETYLNHVSYGHRALGVEAAAQVYFGISACDLSLAQSALLAGIPKSPARYNPVRFPADAQKRQHTVLHRLEEWGWITPGLYDAARAETPHLNSASSTFLAPHFTQYVMEREAPQNSIIPTTLDADLQKEVEGLEAAHLERLRSHRVTNAAVVVLDNASGDVLAWAGSVDFFDPTIQGQVNGVTALRQPGSALKPFIYGLAFAQGMTPATIVDDKPFFADGFMPRNYDETYHGRVRLREALACSFNIPAVILTQRLGVEAVLAQLHRFGFASLDQPAAHYGLGLALGNGEVTLLELTNAYAALARGGIWKPTHVLTKAPATQETQRVLDAQSAYQVTHILSDNAARARAFGLNSPFNLPFPIAAKTGTTKDYRDNWAIGYTPDWTIGVWVGNFDGQPMRNVSGITGAAPLFHDVALLMEKRAGSRPFPVPRQLRELDICPDSGELAGPACPTTISEVFSAKHVPKKSCRQHQEKETLTNAPPSSDGTLHIEFPVSGDVFRINPRMPRAEQALHFKATGASPETEIHWFVDGQEIPSEGRTAWWTLRPGTHQLRINTISLMSQQQQSDKKTFTVLAL